MKKLKFLFLALLMLFGAARPAFADDPEPEPNAVTVVTVTADEGVTYDDEEESYTITSATPSFTIGFTGATIGTDYNALVLWVDPSDNETVYRADICSSESYTLAEGAIEVTEQEVVSLNVFVIRKTVTSDTLSDSIKVHEKKLVAFRNLLLFGEVRGGGMATIDITPAAPETPLLTVAPTTPTDTTMDDEKWVFKGGKPVSFTFTVDDEKVDSVFVSTVEGAGTPFNVKKLGSSNWNYVSEGLVSGKTYTLTAAGYKTSIAEGNEVEGANASIQFSIARPVMTVATNPEGTTIPEKDGARKYDESAKPVFTYALTGADIADYLENGNKQKGIEINVYSGWGMSQPIIRDTVTAANGFTLKQKDADAALDQGRYKIIANLTVDDNISVTSYVQIGENPVYTVTVGTIGDTTYKFNISTEHVADGWYARLDVVDEEGNSLKVDTATAEKTQISINGLANGTYYYKVVFYDKNDAPLTGQYDYWGEFTVKKLTTPSFYNATANDIFVTLGWSGDVDGKFQIRVYDTVKKTTDTLKFYGETDGLTNNNNGTYTYNKIYNDSAVYMLYMRALTFKADTVYVATEWVELQGQESGRRLVVAPIKDATLAWGANAWGENYVKGGQQNLASARTLYFQSNARVGTSAGNALVAVEVAYHDTTVYDTVKYVGYNGVEYRISNPYPRYGTTRVEAHLLKVGFDGKVYGVWGDDVVRDTFNVMGMTVTPAEDQTIKPGDAEPIYHITVDSCDYGTTDGKYFVRVSYQCQNINGNASYKLYDTIKTKADLANYALIDWRNEMETGGEVSTSKDTILYLSFELWPVGGENYFSSTNRQVKIYAPVPEFTIDTLSSFNNNMALDSARGVWISKSEDLGIATQVSFDNDDNRYFCKYELRDDSYQKVTNTAGTLLDDGYCLVGLYGLNYTLMGIPNGENYHLRLSLYECIGRDENNDNILVQLSRVGSISLTFDVKAPVIVVTTTGVLDTVEGEFTSLQSGTYKVDYWHYAANSVPELSVDLENVGMNLGVLLADDDEATAMYGIYADGAENTIAYGYLSDTNTTVKLLTSDGDTLLDGNYNVSIMVFNGDYSIEIMKDLYIRIGAPALLSVSCGPEGEFTPAEDAFTTNNPEFTVNVENAGEGWYVVASVTNMEGEEGEELYDTARADKLKLTFENLPNAIGEWSAAYVAVFELYNADGNMLKRVRKYFDIAGPDVPVMAVTPALAEGRYEALGTTGYLFKDSLPVFSAVVAGVKYYDEYKVEGQLYIKDTFNTGSTNYLKLVKVDADEDVEINYDTLLADGDYVAQTTLLHLNSKTDTYEEAAFDTIFFTVKYEAPVVKPTLTVEPESGYTTAEGVDWVFATANPRISFEAEGINEYWVKAFVYNTDSMSGDVPMLVDSALVITDGVYVFGGEDGYILGNYKATFMLCDTNDKEVGDLVVKNFRIAENPEMTVIPMGRVYADTGKAYIFKTNSPKFDATVAGIINYENYRIEAGLYIADSATPIKTVFVEIERESVIVDFDTTLDDGKYYVAVTLQRKSKMGDYAYVADKEINFTVKYVAPSTAELEIEPVSAYLVGEDVDWIFATANPTLSFTVDTLKDWAVIANVYNLDSAAGDVAPLVETATISNEGKYTFGGDGYTLGNYEATFMLVDPNNNDEALWDAAIVRKFRIGENPEMVVAPAESSRAIGDTGNSYIFRNNKAEFDIDVVGVIEFGKYRIEAQLYNRKAFDAGSTDYIQMIQTDSLTPSMLVAFDSVLADGQYVAHIAIQKLNKRDEYEEVYGAHKDMFFTVAYKEAVEATLTVTPKSEFTAGTDVDWVFATTKPELKFEVEGLEKWSVIAAIYNAAETTEVSVPVSCDTINAASFVFGGANGFAVGNYDAKFMLVDENGEDVLDAYIVKSFTISQSVAREEAELLGVNVYPNPTSGLFNVSVPVRADVTIFNASGRVVAGETRVEGLRSYTLNASGVYFVRVAAEGKTTVKRVIVR